MSMWTKGDQTRLITTSLMVKPKANKRRAKQREQRKELQHPPCFPLLPKKKKQAKSEMTEFLQRVARVSKVMEQTAPCIKVEDFEMANPNGRTKYELVRFVDTSDGQILKVTFQWKIKDGQSDLAWVIKSLGGGPSVQPPKPPMSHSS